MSNQNGLTILGEHHQIPFPVTWLSALADVGRASLDRDTSLNVINGATTSVSAPAALTFPSGQEMAPTEIFGAPDLRIDEPIDRLIADDLPLTFFLQSTGHLGRRPALPQPSENPVLKIGIAQQ